MSWLLKLCRLYGATIGGRTRDLILTMDALYQLSYRGTYLSLAHALYSYETELLRHIFVTRLIIPRFNEKLKG